MTRRHISVWMVVLLLYSPSGTLAAGESTATGTSNSFNPAISVNGLFLGYYASDPFALEPAFGHPAEGELHEGETNEGPLEDDHGHEDGGHTHGLPEISGLTVQELEIRLTTNVDAYLRADVILAIPGTEGIELEEAFIESVGLRSLALRAGKFYSSFGKHNVLHTHAYPFVDGPLVQERLLGGEGLNEVGVRVSFLLPSIWFSEFDVEILEGQNELYNAGSDLAYVGSWKNVWDLGDASTFEIGTSYGAGQNEADALTQLIGADATYRWRPTRRGAYRSVVFQTEYIQARVNDGSDVEKAGGLTAHFQVQTAKRWWFQGRYDLFGIPNTETDRQHRLSALVGLIPSEFSAFRLQYSLNRQGSESVHQLAFQINFTMGAHPAHAY